MSITGDQDGINDKQHDETAEADGGGDAEKNITLDKDVDEPKTGQQIESLPTAVSMTIFRLLWVVTEGNMRNGNKEEMIATHVTEYAMMQLSLKKW